MIKEIECPYCKRTTEIDSDDFCGMDLFEGTEGTLIHECLCLHCDHTSLVDISYKAEIHFTVDAVKEALRERKHYDREHPRENEE